MTQIKVRGVFSVQYEDGTVDDVHVDAIRLVEGVCVCFLLQRLKQNHCWFSLFGVSIHVLQDWVLDLSLLFDWSDEEQCVDIESIKSQTSCLGCAMNTIYSYV
jgi:hypothetical protein